MATYDLLMIAILAGLTLYGYFKGMAWQIAFIASFVASYFLAVRFADRIAPQITFVDAPWNKFVAMALIYAVASFGVWMAFRVVRGAIDSIKMEGFDHQMGAILGFGRGVLWCIGVTFLTLTVIPLPATQKQQIVNSKSGYYIARLLDETDSLFPPEIHQVVGPYLDRLGTELGSGRTQPPSSSTASNASGWPNSGAQPPAQDNSPAWPQSYAPTSKPTTPAEPDATDHGWPSAPGSQPAPSSQATWPDWSRTP